MIGKTLRKILYAFCGIQFFNAFMDYLVWFTNNYYAPSWALATIMLFNAIIILLLLKMDGRITHV